MSSSSSSNKRNLPSWMSSRQPQDQEEQETKHQTEPQFSKLLEGVVFVLSGFVNPERGELRSRALEMGARFQPDWNPDCTLLVCAFPNTPKFHQVEAGSGTIVSKEWITECYNQRKLVEIEPYLLHAGKPWRSSSQRGVSAKPSQDHKAPSAPKSSKHIDKSLNSRSCASSEGKPFNQASDSFSPSRVKKWAADDLVKTISWLESQDEKPEQSEIKKVAAEGVLTCLQDAIDTLDHGQRIQQISDQWACIPRVVEELIKYDDDNSSKDEWGLVSKEELCKHAMACRQIYAAEYRAVDAGGDDSSITKCEKKKMRASQKETGKRKNEEERVDDGDEGYDSDETLVMTEEEIEQAYSTVASRV
ncbi:OLC1v1011967C1 [Oldenlandia corymbosa var. corymbosa]|uniref:OLC1v1011967C1 n=1 Tax=Oldenlandia corymbosa var. corymbosa TaxID=529605 RepID=A0AAV1DXA3_OLDCO|nr:OLC1v1011967C1 [Oldenlandia corymbosa var. corymbosa]